MSDRVLQDVSRKIERQKQFIASARSMRQATDNPAMQSRVDNEIRNLQKNLMYLEDTMRELQLNSSPTSAGQGQHGSGTYSQMQPPNAPFAQQSNHGPKPRPNYTKLDLIKYDTPHLGPRIQLMLSQLQFKLSVEKQYKEGIEKMASLYRMDGDRKSKADAEAKRVESNQKIQLLKQALKRYEDLHVDFETDDQDDDSINAPNIRRPLTGRLLIRVIAVKDVDHAATSRFARGPETSVVIKVEDQLRVRTKTTRNDKWGLEESHDLEVDKANEIEIIVSDKPGDHVLPIGLLWVRLSDIAEEMRRKKIEQEIAGSGWVRAENMGNNQEGPTSPTNFAFPGPPPNSGSGMFATASGGRTVAQAAPQGDGSGHDSVIDAWFALEPVGQIRLQLSFVKYNKKPRLELGLGRQGAVRQRKEEIHEKYGHKFVQQQFYNIMRCALCGDFLKYSAGYQCTDCKYTCHKKCYQKVVTKCISKSNAETDPEEEKINHRIPHRFEGTTNIGANWCCHCGYMLPIGKKNARKCTECGLTCHAQCAHLVPDFCGMSMEVANQILSEMRRAPRQGKVSGQRQSGSGRPSSQQPTSSYGSGSEAGSQAGSHLSYQPASPVSATAADKAYRQPAPYSPSSPQYQQPVNTAAASAATQAMQAARLSTQQQPGQQTYSYSGQPPYNPAAHAASTAQNAPYPQAPYSPTHGGFPQDFYGQGQQGQQPQMKPQGQQPYPDPTQPQYGAANQLAQQRRPSFPAIQGQPDPRTQQQQVQQVPAKAPPAQVAPVRQPKIGLDHFNFLAVLGKGNFGKVMLAETKSTKKLYAIKVLKKEFIIENDEVESMKSEKRVFLIANKARHPFLLNLHACFQTETRVYFVMEYVSGGDLMLHIQREQFGTRRAQFYAAEVCLALKYFHDNNVIYRDLKLDNILLTLDGHIKIADYGLCKENMGLNDTTSTFCGTPEFMAPEILLDKRYGRAVDWWAFGVLIYQMLLQQSPFRGEDEDEIYDAILTDEPLYPIQMPRDSVQILQKLLTREPEHRLGSGPTDAEEIMNHPFFKNVNWDDIYHKRITPPYKPTIKSATDTSNFDSEFTSVTPVLTPVNSVLTATHQEEFRGFSYACDFA